MKKNLILFIAIICSIFTFKAVAQVNTSVSDFNGVIIDGPLNVIIEATGSESLKLDLEEKSLRNIKIDVVNHRLIIRLKENFNSTTATRKANVYISVKNLHYVENAGSGYLDIQSTINAKDLTFALSGSGNLKAAVQSENLTVRITGSGSINLTGNTGNANFKITGSGQILGKELTATSAFAAITGSGSAYVNVLETISGRISASGNLVYTGTAQIANARYTASGRIIKKE